MKARGLLAGFAALAIAGCAANPPVVADPAALRGRNYAVTHCAGCHAVGLEGVSPYRAAPPFRSLRSDWSSLGLRLRLERSPVHNGADMDPREITPEDGAALAAYLRLTRAGKAPGPPAFARPICAPIYWC